jgi:hypothetical protein
MVTLTPAQAVELRQLHEAHALASQRTLDAIKAHTMDSPEYREAEAATGKIWKQIRKLQGKSGEHWMS